MKILKKLSIFIPFLFLLLFAFAPTGNQVIAADPVTTPNNANEQVGNIISDKDESGACKDPFKIWKEDIASGKLHSASAGLGAIECLVAGIINFLLELAWIIAAIFVAISGIKYQMSAGNPAARTKAMASLNAAIIGFALVLCVFAALNFFLAFIEYQSFIQNNLPTY